MRLQIDRKNTADMGAMKEIQTFASDESGVGVIELVLILVDHTERGYKPRGDPGKPYFIWFSGAFAR